MKDISDLASSDIQDFIFTHEHEDDKKLVLKGKEILGFPSSLVADQISGRRKMKDKVPLYFNTRNIIYPPGLNLEQSSSQETALYKCEIIKSLSIQLPVSIVDLTGGFGIDSFFFSSAFDQVDYIEPNGTLLKIAKHNHEVLNARNVKHHHTTAEEFLKGYDKPTSVFYIDPSRRNKDLKKVVSLHDCVPDIAELHGALLERASYVLVKTSPMLDVKQGLKELRHVKKVYIVSVSNECKEVLFLLEQNYSDEPEIATLNIQGDRHDHFKFLYSQEELQKSIYSEPLKFLYEPNASILKAGAFKTIGESFRLSKLSINTHLYTSEDLYQDFPGRIFKIEASIKADAKSTHEFFSQGKANVITRNYPLTVDELKKKLKLKDGGDQYLIGCSSQSKKHLLAASRIK